jgi:metallo-beta-lactamase class B
MRFQPAALLLTLPALAGNPPEWSQPVAPFHIAGPVYSVGTAELGCYLIRGTRGCILINTGLADSPKLIEKSLKTLGVDRHQVQLLLTNQAHADHVGGFRKMQRLTGARIWATVQDAPLLESGGAEDPGGLPGYKAVQVDRLLTDGEEMVFGDLKLKVILTPGHTPGSVSYLLSYPEGGATRTVLFANLPTVVMPLKNPKYPGIVQDLELSFARLKALHPDLWVAAHVSQCGLLAKAKAGQFEDPEGYTTAVADCEADFRAKLQAERP